MTTEITTKQIEAAELNRRIIMAAQLAQQSLYEMCMGFKEMRDSKLYKELGYSNFEAYCEKEVGISRQWVYKYVAVAEKLPEDFVNSSLQNSQVSISKLYLLTTLSEEERTELTENTDLENTTVKELEQQIKTLRAEKDKAVAEKSAAEAQTAAKDDTITALEKTKQQLDEQIDNLRSEVKALENRPVETAVETVIPPDYITKEAYDETVKTYTDKLAEAEKRLEEVGNAEAVSDNAGVFKAYLTNAYNSLNVLVEYVQDHTEFVPNVRRLVDNVKKSLDETV